VTRDAIRQKLWGNNSLIDFEGRLNFCVRKIRIVLGDNSKRPRYIETLPRRGYRFVAESSTHPHGLPAGARRNGVPSGRPMAVGAISSGDSRRAIAIVEFLNVSGDPEIDWLATGIAETLAADLRRLPSIWVVSPDRVRATAAKLGRLGAARPPADCLRLGRELNVEWVVSGSYQRAGSRLRITPQLAKIRTGEVIAVGKIDGTWEQLFEWQDRLASALIGALELETAVSRHRPGDVIESRHVQAYEEYSRARMRFRQLDKASLDDARRHFQRALELDPQYAMAQAGLGATHAMRFIHRTNPADLSDAKSHLQVACELDAELAEPYPWLCYVYIRDGQLREAQRTGQRAIELLPDLVQAHYFLALAYFVSCESDPSQSQYQQAADHLLRAASHLVCAQCASAAERELLPR
jgi:adenylate cyclase